APLSYLAPAATIAASTALESLRREAAWRTAELDLCRATLREVERSSQQPLPHLESVRPAVAADAATAALAAGQAPVAEPASVAASAAAAGMRMAAERSLRDLNAAREALPEGAVLAGDEATARAVEEAAAVEIQR
ncbi:unnamed protein product, partial [Phaeothamnion confervicola]